METKETSLETVRGDMILEDTEYYKYIFKKTEKMACAVFYILRQGQNTGYKDSVVDDLEKQAQALLDVSLASLRSTVTTVEEEAVKLRHALIVFASKLRIAHAARILSPELLDVFMHEIDSVQRSLKKYTEPHVANPLTRVESQGTSLSFRERRPAQARLTRAKEVDTAMGTPTLSRKDRILDILKDKGEATIKDIVEVITDCSEKTIQRELISLIKDNVVVREGERRWSKYKLI